MIEPRWFTDPVSGPSPVRWWWWVIAIFVVWVLPLLGLIF